MTSFNRKNYHRYRVIGEAPRTKIACGKLALLAVVLALALWVLVFSMGVHASGDKQWIGKVKCVNPAGCAARSRITGYKAHGVTPIAYGTIATGIPPLHRLRHAIRPDQFLIRVDRYWYDVRDLRTLR